MLKTLTAILVALAAAGCAVPAQQPAPVQPAEHAARGGGESGRTPVGLAAEPTTVKKSVLSDAGALTCVRVTVTNRTDGEVVKVNVLYFAITGDDGVKRSASSAHGDYDGIDMVSLAPGERARGDVCVAGRFRAKTVSMEGRGLGVAVRAEVAP